jgi:cytoskeletal protein CcmA (bactofilin family)
MKIHKTGKVSGKLSYAELDIDRGGQFVGTMNGTKT